MTVTNDFRKVSVETKRLSICICAPYELSYKAIIFKDEHIFFSEKSTWFFDCQSNILWLPFLCINRKWQLIEQRTKDSRWELIDGFSFHSICPKHCDFVFHLSGCKHFRVYMWLVIKILQTVNQMNIWHTHTNVCESKETEQIARIKM